MSLSDAVESWLKEALPPTTYIHNIPVDTVALPYQTSNGFGQLSSILTLNADVQNDDPEVAAVATLRSRVIQRAARCVDDVRNPGGPFGVPKSASTPSDVIPSAFRDAPSTVLAQIISSTI